LGRTLEIVTGVQKGSLTSKRKRSVRNGRASIDHDSATVQNVIDAAATLFADKGFYGTRIDDIAQLANINKTMLYYHIGNKQRIYEVVLETHFKQIADMIESAVKGCEDPIEGLNIIVRIHAHNFKSDHRAPRTIAHEFAGGSTNMTPEAYSQYVRIYSLTQRYVQKGIASGIFRHVDPAQVNLMLNGTVLMSVITGSFLENLAKYLCVSSKTAPTIDDMAEFAFNAVINFLTGKDPTT
jgi:TetR/AcrR family transcriptional regulator